MSRVYWLTVLKQGVREPESRKPRVAAHYIPELRDRGRRPVSLRSARATVPSRPTSIGNEKKDRRTKDFGMKGEAMRVQEQNKHESVLCVTITLKFRFSGETGNPQNKVNINNNVQF